MKGLKMGKYTPKLPKAVIEFEVRNKDGKLIQKGKFPAKSWVGNIIRLLNALWNRWANAAQAGIYYIVTPSVLLDTSNTARSLIIGTSDTGYFGGAAPAGDTSAGILVGTSDTPVSLAQYSLMGLIAHGTGAGQLSYGATNVEDLTTGTTYFFRIIRTFTNNSGATVTVKELGLFLKPLPQSFMFARDVPASPINVPNGSTLTLRYIISHSLS
jgi:hypothetical protein